MAASIDDTRHGIDKTGKGRVRVKVGVVVGVLVRARV